MRHNFSLIAFAFVRFRRSIAVTVAISLSAGTIIALLSPFSAHAATVVDQSCCASANAEYFFDELTRVQTFTVGLSGQLTGIDLGLLPGSVGIPTFEFFSGAFVDGQAVATFGVPLVTLSAIDTGVPIPGSSFGGTLFFADLSGAGLFVSPGQQFSIVMRPLPVNDGNGGWIATSGNPYAGGTELTTTLDSTANLVAQTDDASFSTFVSISTVPEPSTLLLISVGLVSLIARRRF